MIISQKNAFTPDIGLLNGRMHDCGIGESDATDVSAFRKLGSGFLPDEHPTEKQYWRWSVCPSSTWMSCLSSATALFFNKNMLCRPIVPVIFIVAVIGCVPFWPVICPISIIISPVLFGMGSFLASWCWCWARCCLWGDIGLLWILLRRFSSFAFAVAFSFSFPCRHSFERILTFHSFLALLAFTFVFSFAPESWVVLVIFPCCITFTFWPRTEAGSWSLSFLTIALRLSFLECSAE